MHQNLTMAVPNGQDFEQSGDTVAQESNPIDLTNGGSSSSNGDAGLKPAVEACASWRYRETGLLLYLWGQDSVQRELLNAKRSRHVWQQIAQQLCEQGYDRTADQVRTRVSNMIAEYRRITKNPTPERKKKCIFYESLHRLYQEKDIEAIESAILNSDNIEVSSDAEEGNDFFCPMSPTSYDLVLRSSTEDAEGYPDDQMEDMLPRAKRSRHETNQLFDAYHQGKHGSLSDNSTLVALDRLLDVFSKMYDKMNERDAHYKLVEERLAKEVALRKANMELEKQREANYNDRFNKMLDIISQRNTACKCHQAVEDVVDTPPTSQP